MSFNRYVLRWGIFPLWVLLSATILFRHPLPIDETRYLSVAWEMWLRGDFLVPYLNGHPYSHKPPLLFWLFQAGWTVFGVNEWWPRSVGPLCALGNLLLVRQLARRLWPDDEATALKSPWILIATLLWALFATSTMFDILLTVCVLLGMLGLVEASQGSTLRGWGLFSLAAGFGILAKGPVIFIHLLPAAMLVFLWRGRQVIGWRRWYAGLTVALLIACIIALSWALPAAYSGGDSYAGEILWRQTADRTLHSKIHARPFFWYLPFLPLALFPWIVWPQLWRNAGKTTWNTDMGLRFCLLWFSASLVIFSILPSKQLHYLIPALPAFALMVARLSKQSAKVKLNTGDWIPPALMALAGLLLIALPYLSGLNWVRRVEPQWGASVLIIAIALAAWVMHSRRLSVVSLSAAVVLSIVSGFYFFFHYTGLQYDLRPAARLVKEFNRQHVSVAFVGDYQGQLHFLARLTEPLPVIAKSEIDRWSRLHPDGYLITLEKKPPAAAFYSQPHREYWLVFTSTGQWHADSRSESAG